MAANDLADQIFVTAIEGTIASLVKLRDTLTQLIENPDEVAEESMGERLRESDKVIECFADIRNMFVRRNEYMEEHEEGIMLVQVAYPEPPEGVL